MELTPPPPSMPMHNFRCPDDIWERVKVEAADSGISASAFIRAAVLMLLLDRDEYRSRDHGAA